MPTDLGDGVPRYSRREWGATGDGGSPGPKARDHVVEHTFAMDGPGPGASVDTEKAIMRSVDRYHQRRFSRHGIGYAEVTTDSGRVYEGRGPGRWLAHARGLNDTAYGFGHMGHGNRKPRGKGAWRAGRALHRWYRRKGWIAKLRYRLTGHRDHSDYKDCPGTLVSDDDLEQLRPDATPPPADEPQEDDDMKMEIWVGPDPDRPDDDRDHVWLVQRDMGAPGEALGYYSRLPPDQAKHWRHLAHSPDRPDVIEASATAARSWFADARLARKK